MRGKRYRKRGWFGEPHRHYLASKGIKTKHENLKDFSQRTYSAIKTDTNWVQEDEEEMRENVQRVIDKNPRLKEKVEKGVNDIVITDLDGLLGVYKVDEDVIRIDDNLALGGGERLKEVLEHEARHAIHARLLTKPVFSDIRRDDKKLANAFERARDDLDEYVEHVGEKSLDGEIDEDSELWREAHELAVGMEDLDDEDWRRVRGTEIAASQNVNTEEAQKTIRKMAEKMRSDMGDQRLRNEMERSFEDFISNLQFGSDQMKDLDEIWDER